MTQKMKITYSDGSTKIEDKVMKIEPYVEPKKIYANWSGVILTFNDEASYPANKGGHTEKEALVNRLELYFTDSVFTADVKRETNGWKQTVKELAKRL